MNARNAGARLIARLDRLLVVMHAGGRRAISILDAGCGESDVLNSLVNRASAYGFAAVDVVGLRHAAGCVGEESFAVAAGRSSALRVMMAEPDDRGLLPFDDGEFDIVILAENANRGRIRECERVTCKGGVLVPRY